MKKNKISCYLSDIDTTENFNKENLRERKPSNTKIIQKISENMVEERKKIEQYAINRSNIIQSINQEKSIEQYTTKS